MFEISYLQMFIIITVLWIAVRGIIAYKNKSISLAQEAKMILVYICLVVIARMVYFPFGLVDGHIGKLEFDGSKIMPLWLNVIPIVHLFDIYDGWQINIIGNITMFIPVGIVWPVCFKKLDTIGKTVLAGAGFTLLIEITQLPFYDRCSDIDDIILNTTGVLIGALIYFGCTKKKRKTVGLMLLSLMLIGCGNTKPVQDTEDIALTEAPMEEEQVSPEEKIPIPDAVHLLYATNYMLYKERTTFTGDNRYKKIHETIDNADSMSADEAMELLDSVHQMTRWSAVYNLEKLSVDVCFNENYDKKWTEGL